MINIIKILGNGSTSTIYKIKVDNEIHDISFGYSAYSDEEYNVGDIINVYGYEGNYYLSEESLKRHNNENSITLIGFIGSCVSIFLSFFFIIQLILERNRK